MPSDPTQPDLEGPFDSADLGGVECPWYMLRFDAKGRLLSPRTAELLIAAVAGSAEAGSTQRREGEHGGATDVIVFSHGWNNDWRRATELYRAFLGELGSTMAADPPTRALRPIFVGINWPSVSLVRRSEAGPRIGARGDVGAYGDEPVAEADGADDGSLDPASFEALLAEAAEAAAEGNLEFVDGLEEDADPDALPGFVDESSAIGSGEPSRQAGPEAASGGRDPRRLARVFTVWKMKDRAGEVGAVGVGELLRRLLEITHDGTDGPRFHLVGHSFGARVMLTALSGSCTAESRPVRSLLLLQPAVNAWCFARDVAGEGFAGGFRPALSRVELPIVSTYSPHDGPLCKVFPLALRRRRDLGETRMASGVGKRWASLGGIGPLGLGDGELLRLPMPAPGEPYAGLSTAHGPKIVALDGEKWIANHGDVANPAAAWALYALMEGTS